MPNCVFDAVHQHLALESQIGGYEAHAQAADDCSGFYTELAALLNAKPSEIAFVENATRAWDMAFFSLPLQQGDRILTHSSEYVSNYLCLMLQAKKRGVAIDIIPSDDSGQIDTEAIAPLIQSKTRLIAITHVPTQGGLVNPAAEVGRIAKEHGVLFLLDACQSAGQIDLDVEAIQCDMLSGTGRKYLRGPRGTGFLYVKQALANSLEPPFIDLEAATWSAPDRYELALGAKRFENWERFVAGQIGLMHAVRYARRIGLPAIEIRVKRLAQSLRERLAQIPGVTVHDLGREKSGIVTFTKTDTPPKVLATQLRSERINISVSHATSAQLDLGARRLPELARASVHYYNTDAEVETFSRAVFAA